MITLIKISAFAGMTPLFENDTYGQTLINANLTENGFSLQVTCPVLAKTGFDFQWVCCFIESMNAIGYVSTQHSLF